MEEDKRENMGEQQVIIVEEEEEEEEEEEVLPGFRFHPTDEELVGFYLRRKVEKKAFSIDIIKEIDIYKHDPWDLPKVMSAGEKEWYFFCLRGRKYRNSIRPNRVTGSGFWKATGIDRSIYSTTNTAGECIGLKKSLVYYIGSAGKGTKTDWMMHEFRLPSNNTHNTNTCPSMQEAEIWTICRIFKRNATYKKSSTVTWKESNINNKIKTLSTTDSNSKTSSSFESDDGGNESKSFASALSYPPQENVKYIGSTYYEESARDQMYVSSQFWNSSSVAAQADPMTALQYYSDVVVPSPKVNDFFKDDNWDELGRIVFMADQNVDRHLL